jgi:hypothetical protein
MAPVPFSVIVPTAYGQMIVNRNDINQTNPLFKTGLAIDHDEISMLGEVLRLCEPDPVFIDNTMNYLCIPTELTGKIVVRKTSVA